MLEVALMIEGQDGLDWPRWQRLARAAEHLGFVGLFRSDHYSNPDGPYLDALELWTSLTWLASNTSRIEFGPLVSPVSFRDPRVTAWTALAVDDLSGGRLRLGLGAGWQDREHRAFGYDLLAVGPRFERFEQALEVIARLLRSNRPVSYRGRYYRLEDAQLLPRPARPGGPPIVIGGKGPRRTLPLVAAYADEWNAVGTPPDGVAALNRRLDELLRERGREPAAVRRSYMHTLVVGRDAAEQTSRARGEPPEQLRARGGIVGTPNEVVDLLGRYAEAGVQRVMARWLDLDDLAGIEAFAREVIPQLQ